ncbi:MAG: hypothetical protein FWD16_03455, partial [Clostridia bacterium]|nr:hypothetical protein [Clostridia bacterium]
VRENPEMIEDLRMLTKRFIIESMQSGERDISLLRNNLRDRLREMIWDQTKRNPVILPMVEILRR